MGPRMDSDFADFAAVQGGPLLGFAHALTADPHDAWDLTQETLARMGERWGRSRFDEPAAYARTVMVRLDIDRIRRLRRELPLLGGPRTRRRRSASASWTAASRDARGPAVRRGARRGCG